MHEGGSREDISAEERAGIERYAHLCGDLAAKTAPREEVLRRHGLTEATKASLDAHWGGEMTRRGALRMVWIAALADRKKAP